MPLGFHQAQAASVTKWLLMPALLFVTGEIANAGPPTAAPDGINQDPFHAVVRTLREPKQLRSTFTQNRHIRGLNKPLISKGTFLWDRERGVAWVQAIPFQVAYIISPKGLRQESLTPNLASQKLPSNAALRRFSEMLLSVFNGDERELMEKFDRDFKGDAARWSLALKAKDEQISRIVLSITLAGDQVVRSVKVAEGSGDSTEITFDGVERAPTFTEQESKLLDW